MKANHVSAGVVSVVNVLMIIASVTSAQITVTKLVLVLVVGLVHVKQTTATIVNVRVTVLQLKRTVGRMDDPA